MKRFTKRIDEHVYYTMGQYPETLSAECASEDVRQILKRLADYEDSNLMPEEISSLITTIESLQDEKVINANKMMTLEDLHSNLSKTHHARIGESLELSLKVESQKEKHREELQLLMNFVKRKEALIESQKEEIEQLRAENEKLNKSVERLKYIARQHNPHQRED